MNAAARVTRGIKIRPWPDAISTPRKRPLGWINHKCKKRFYVFFNLITFIRFFNVFYFVNVFYFLKTLAK